MITAELLDTFVAVFQAPRRIGEGGHMTGCFGNCRQIAPSAGVSQQPGDGFLRVGRGMILQHFLADDDISQAEQVQILDLADDLKRQPFTHPVFAGPRSVAMLFDKPTLRTQSSFAAGIAELGGFPMIIDTRLAGIGERESIADTARDIDTVRANYADRFGKTAGGDGPLRRRTGDQRADRQLPPLPDPRRPVDDPPAQGSAGRAPLAYVGDGANNIACSYALGGGLAGLCQDRRANGCQLDPVIRARADAAARASGGSIARVLRVERSPVLMSWRPTPTPAGSPRCRERAFAPYALTAELLAQAAPDAIVLHCLPAYRGKEIAAEVIDGPQSVVWDQAENRRHAQKALLVFLDGQARDEGEVGP